MIDAELAFSEGHRMSGSGQWNVRGRVTDADGRFVLRAVPAGTVWLSAFAPGRGSRTHHPVRVPSAGEVVIALGVVPGAAVAGRVTDSEGAPIPHAAVLARAEVRWIGMGFSEMVARTTRTNDDGRYEVAHLPPGKLYRLRVVADGFLASDFIGYGLPLPAGVTTPFDVVLLRPGTVTGKVVDAAGQAIAGAEVFLGNGPSPSSRSAPGLPALCADGRRWHLPTERHPPGTRPRQR